MKKKTGLLLLILLVIISNVPAHGLKPMEERLHTVENIAPRTELNYKETKIPHKIDLVIGKDIMSNWADIQEHVNNEIIPVLEQHEIDYQITYLGNVHETSKTLLSAIGQDHITLIKSDGSIQVKQNMISSFVNVGNKKDFLQLASTSNYTYGVDKQGHVFRRNGNATFSPYFSNPKMKSIRKAAGDSDYIIGIGFDGKVYEWNDSTQPVEVTGFSNIVDAHRSGRWDSNKSYVAVDADGHVWVKGFNLHRQLDPSGPTTPIEQPVKLESLSNIVSVTTGSSASFAIDDSGRLYSWGTAYLVGRTDYTENLFGIVDVPSIRQLEVAGNVVWAATETDGMYRWGYLCDGCNPIPTPQKVSQYPDNIAAFAMGGGTTSIPAYITTDGVIYPFIYRNDPIALSAGKDIGAFVSANGKVFVAGSNYSQLLHWDPDIYVRTAEVQPLPGGARPVKIDVADDQLGFIVADDGRVYTFGGISSIAPRRVSGYYTNPIPVQFAALKEIVDLKRFGGSSSSSAYAMALDKRGILWSWGANGYGQLGNGTTTYSSATPSPVRLSGVVSFDGFADGAIAATRNGDVYVWGKKGAWTANAPANGNGLILTPQKIHLPAKIVQVALTNGIAAALDEDGGVWTWGQNSQITTGHGNTNALTTPTKLANIPAIKTISAGELAIGLLTTTGRIYSWGNNAGGVVAGTSNHPQYGNRSRFEFPIPNDYISNVTDIAFGDGFVLAARSNGTLYGWGSNSYRQTFTGSTNSYVYTPTSGGVMNSASIYGNPKQIHEELQEIQWREGAKKYILYVTDNKIRELDRAFVHTQMLEELLSQNIHLLYIGSKSNEQAIRRLITNNLGKGKFIQAGADPSLDYRKLARYMTNAQPVDLVFNIGQTSKDNKALIESKIHQILIPFVENMGIELQATVIDGERIPENRVYMLRSQRVYVFDPQDHQVKLLTNTPVHSAAIGKDGNLYMLGTDRRTVYQHNTETHETSVLFTETVDISQMVVDGDNIIHYIHSSRSYGSSVELSSYNPATDAFTSGSVITSYIMDLRPNPYGGAAYKFPGAYGANIVHPIRVEEVLDRDYYLNEDGCLYTSTGLYANVTQRAYRDNAFCYAIDGHPYTVGPFINGGKGITYYYLRESQFVNYQDAGLYRISSHDFTRTLLVPGVVYPYVATPEGKVYYLKGGTAYSYNERSGESVAHPHLSSNIHTAIPYYNFPDSRRLRKYGLIEGLEQAAWRADADTFYVHMHDGSIGELNQPAARAQFMDMLEHRLTTFIGLGTAANRAQLEAFIDEDGYGTFIDNTDLDQAISELALFIANNAGLRKPDTIGTIVLDYLPESNSYISGELTYETTYSDWENDSKFQERFIYEHDDTVYEHSLGTIPEHGQILDEPLKRLTKPGKYTIAYQAMDEPKNDHRFDAFKRWSNEAKITIMAHRRPFALFSVNLTPNADKTAYDLSLTDHSYDLDRYSYPNRGIVEWEWKWKKLDGDRWTAGMPPDTVYADEQLLISLRVKDVDGAWSDESIRTLFTDAGNIKPQALFTITKRIYVDQTFFIEDLSHDPDGDPIVEWHWSVVKDGVELYEGASQPTAAGLRSAAAAKEISVYGNYTVTLRVRDYPANGISLWSDPYSDTFEVANRPPAAAMIYPDGTEDQPTVVNTNRPTFRWSQTDPDPNTVFTRFQLRIHNEWGTMIVLDSGERTQNTSAALQTWTASIDLPEQKLQAQVRVFDGMDWSNWSEPAWFTVLLNRPPVADFDWTPKPVWEGDPVQLINHSTDPDGDPLQYVWTITDPKGGSVIVTDEHPIVTFMEPGIYQVNLQASDGRAAHSISKPILANLLMIEPDVRHTPEWLAYHLEHGHNTTFHPKDFYAGEKFVLQVTPSPAPVASARAWMSATGISGKELYTETSLHPAVPDADHAWIGELYDERWISLTDGLPLGEHLIHFELHYANGKVKTASLPVRMIGNALGIVGVHRVR